MHRGGFSWNFFDCYGYGRLSREDYQRTGVRDESNSIKIQRDLIHKFVSDRPELQLVMEGYDDGYTGTNFDRPQFPGDDRGHQSQK